MSAHRSRIGTLVAALGIAAAGAGVGAQAAPTSPVSHGPMAILDERAIKRLMKKNKKAGIPAYRATPSPERDADRTLRRSLEAIVGPMSGRQWTRVRRWYRRSDRFTEPARSKVTYLDLRQRNLTPLRAEGARTRFALLPHIKGAILLTVTPRKKYAVPSKALA
jgi:hypothetical protein